MSYETGTATDYADLLDKLNSFLAKGHALPPAWTGTGTGVLSGLIGTTASVQETITVTWTSATAFTVTGSVSGSLGAGTVGTAFSSAVVAFTATAGTTAWVAGDKAVFVMTRPLTAMRSYPERAADRPPVASERPHHLAKRLLRARGVGDEHLGAYDPHPAQCRARDVRVHADLLGGTLELVPSHSGQRRRGSHRRIRRTRAHWNDSVNAGTALLNYICRERPSEWSKYRLSIGALPCDAIRHGTFLGRRHAHSDRQSHQAISV